MIHDNVCDSRKLNAVSFEAAELWFRLVTRVDDNGNFYRDSLRVYAMVMPEKKGCTQTSTEGALKELERVGLIKSYKADGRPYLHVSDFEKHQNLRQDFPADVSHPIHPEDMGAAYTENGKRRSQCIRTTSEPLDNRDRTGTEPGPNHKGTEMPVTVEVEVEVKDKVEDKVEGEASELTHTDLKTLKTIFREQTGAKAKIGSKTGERLAELCARYGMTAVLDALPKWVEDEGGKASIQNDKRKREWACSNFLRDAEEIIEAMRSGAFEAKPESAETLPRLQVPF